MKEIYKSGSYSVFENSDTIKIKSRTSPVYMIIITGIITAGVFLDLLPIWFALISLGIIWLFFFIIIHVAIDIRRNKIWRAITIFDKVISLSFYLNVTTIQIEFMEDSSDMGTAYVMRVVDLSTHKKELLFQLDSISDFYVFEKILREKDPNIKIKIIRGTV